MRVETALPDFASEYPISGEQAAQFQRDGFIILKGVLSPDEVTSFGAAIRADAYRAFERDGAEPVFGGALIQKLNFRFESDAMSRYALSRRVGSIGARLSLSPAVRIYHEQLLFKPPSGAPSYWHQDQYFWPLKTEQSIGTWLPLSDVTAEQGALRYVRCSHRLGDLGQFSIDEQSEAYFNRLAEENHLEVVQIGHMSAGDMCVHNGWTVHGAAPNRTNAMREAIVVTMYPDGTCIDTLHNDYRKSDRVDFLGGKPVGAIADSELNTVIFAE